VNSALAIAFFEPSVFCLLFFWACIPKEYG
jgi:hypothetical protein